MGEVVVSSEDPKTRVKAIEESQKRGGGSGGGGGVGDSSGLLKLLPRMMLRVLLVEADDSTRQIITALLRKCSYRVAAVPDGLKAWEVLKGRPHNIDLILTEVDLPSISGFALLTLIMEHNICKNIPVIMMSSQDSISTVYKCMLRGAADYLVKPIRINELRNLWQHVWRRQLTSTGINGPQDESVAQQKAEATSENDAASNHSSGDVACIDKDKEFIEKGSDSQSSCTKPDLEAENAPVENLPELSQPRQRKVHPCETEKEEDERCICLGKTPVTCDSHAGVAGQQRKFANTTSEDCENNDILLQSSKEAIDLIGAFHAYPHCNDRSSSVNHPGNIVFSPRLDLSLRRSNTGRFENEVTEERPVLVHSDASAFKRYINRQPQTLPTNNTNFSYQQKACNVNYEKNAFSAATGYNRDSSIPSMQRNVLSPGAIQSKEFQIVTTHSQQVLPVPVAVKGIRFNDLCTAYGSVLPPIFCTQSGPTPVPSPNSVVEMERISGANSFYQLNTDENKSVQQNESKRASNQTPQGQDGKLEQLEGLRHISSATDQSACSDFGNGAVSQRNSFSYGSNCGSKSNSDQVTPVKSALESKNDNFMNSGSTPRSFQREAALTKFRLKRKERCYEKKVRYESRKKLAEQRPRVKGQFVRQLHPDPQPAEKDGISSDA